MNVWIALLIGGLCGVLFANLLWRWMFRPQDLELGRALEEVENARLEEQ